MTEKLKQILKEYKREIKHVEDKRNNTVIIFIGDNGIPNQVAQNPYSNLKVKRTLYQGGGNVPMFISENSVSRNGIDENLISSTDLFAEISI